MKRLLYGTTTAQGNDTTSATNALIVRNSAGTVLLGITNDGSVRVGTNASATTQTTASINASGSGTDIGLALVPKGTGALTAQIPDGTITGGNARGKYAVDLQMARNTAARVASGQYSFIGGGALNTAYAQYSSVVGGYGNTAGGDFSLSAGNSSSAGGRSSVAIGESCNTGAWGAVSLGFQNTATGRSAAAFGDTNTAAGPYSITPGGLRANATLHGQSAIASGVFGSNGDAQTSNIRVRGAITGTTKTELFLDGTSVRAILALPTGATAGRVWNAKIQLIAVCTVQGAGTVTAGEVFGGNYAAIIKRIGTSTSLVGIVQNLHTAQTDTNMATAAVTITADDTNESLKIEFTPPTTAAADTVIRVVATVYLTEVGY